MADGDKHTNYQLWKRMVPYMYDWFTSHNLTWPSLSCRWGPVDTKSEKTFKRKQRLYLSEQTDGSDPNKLVVMNVDIAKPRVAAADALSGFQEVHASPYFKVHKVILHPGEVNKIREVPMYPGVVVTHTDAPELFVWSIDQQPNRAGEKGKDCKPSVANLVLTGHTDNAEFALGTCLTAPYVASGGKDKNVCVWNLDDVITGLAGSGGRGASGGGASGDAEGVGDGEKKEGEDGGAAAPTLAAQCVLQGHTDVVEDVCFSPENHYELASVGDDHQLLWWDTRTPTGATTTVAQAHGDSDLHTVDWNRLNPLHLATGAADGTVKIWDRRNTSSALFSFSLHQGAVMHVEWCPHSPTVLASGAEDHTIALWDLAREISPNPKSSLPAQLFFQHRGHRAQVVDFQWDTEDPWTLVSVSDDVDTEVGGGGTVQVWRVSDLLTRDRGEVLAELEAQKEYIVNGRNNGQVKVGDDGANGSHEHAAAGDGGDAAVAMAPEQPVSAAAPVAPDTEMQDAGQDVPKPMEG